jgi:phage/plasmid-like protein (TIGR03299 family)
MSNRQWHRGVGIAITPAMGLAEQLQAAGLDWTVERSPYRYGPHFEFEDSHNSIAYRSDTGTVLGYFGPRRRPFQNREIVEAFHDFCASSGDGLTIERLGCLNGGKSLFATACLRHQIDVKQVGDVVEARLLLTEHHESGKALQVRLFFNRLICTNGMSQLVRVRGRTLSHMKEFDAQTVREYLEAAYRGVEAHEQRLEQLAEVSIADAEAKMHLVKAFGNVNLDWEEQPRPVQVCYKLFKGEGAGSEKLSAYQTLFGLQESVTEYFNWYAKGSHSERAFNSLCHGSRGQQQDAFVKQLVGVHL